MTDLRKHIDEFEEHIEDHIHEHEHMHAEDLGLEGHGHSHSHGHSHVHDHDQAHEHEHEHVHSHEHDHDGSAHVHEHAHEHSHLHTHDHEHDHLHGHAHEHDHAHDHVHDHLHDHEYHGHSHMNDHDAVHAQLHAYKHMMAEKEAHDHHGHTHTHEHSWYETFGQYHHDEYFERVEELHGFLSPGVIIGGIMVDMALKRLPSGIKIAAIVETKQCLADAVQILTPCSYGNEKIFVVDTGKLAITLFDRNTGEGIRAFVDSKNLDKYPEMRQWVMRTIDKKDQDIDALRDEIMCHAPEVISVMKVTVAKKIYAKKKKYPVEMCGLCYEPYIVKKPGFKCPACDGKSPYTSFE